MEAQSSWNWSYSSTTQGRNLAAFGRSQALTASNLVRARESYDSDVGNLRRQLLEANRKAYAPVKFKPIPGLAPIKPDTDMTGANLAFMGSMVGTAATGLEGYAKLNDGRMPWVQNLKDLKRTNDKFLSIIFERRDI